MGWWRCRYFDREKNGFFALRALMQLSQNRGSWQLSQVSGNSLKSEML